MGYDHSLFLQTMSRFTKTLLTPYDVDSVLDEMAVSLTGVLGLAGAGVTLASDGRLRLATVVTPQIAALERIQHEHEAGPCVDAYRSGKVVAIADVKHQRDRWPQYCAVASRMGVTAVAGIPMRLQDETVGAVNIYAAGHREWPEEDLAAAVVMADMATGYLINDSTLHQQKRLNEQLQAALDSRLVIEQAKGALASSHDISVEDAFRRIRSHARSHHASIGAVAEAIVNLGLQI
jgi:GAF domain-containing protein